MTGITIPAEPQHAQRVLKPWGHEVLLVDASLPYAAKLLHVRAGCRLSLQRHSLKIETLVLVSGEATLTLQDADGSLVEHRMVLNAGFTVLPGRIHRVAAHTDAVLFEASTPEEGVTERLDDDYGRPDEDDAARRSERS